ncbi:unnamed protein product [Victoria cruziana]
MAAHHSHVLLLAYVPPHDSFSCEAKEIPALHRLDHQFDQWKRYERASFQGSVSQLSDDKAITEGAFSSGLRLHQ